MIAKLPYNLHESLKTIACNEQDSVAIPDIKKLAMEELIIYSFTEGWIVNDKGNEYLMEHP